MFITVTHSAAITSPDFTVMKYIVGTRITFKFKIKLKYTTYTIIYTDQFSFGCRPPPTDKLVIRKRFLRKAFFLYLTMLQSTVKKCQRHLKALNVVDIFS